MQYDGIPINMILSLAAHKRRFKELTPDTIRSGKECASRTFSIFIRRATVLRNVCHLSEIQCDFNITRFIHWCLNIADFILKMISIFHSFRPNCLVGWLLACLLLCIPVAIYSTIESDTLFRTCQQTSRDDARIEFILKMHLRKEEDEYNKKTHIQFGFYCFPVCVYANVCQ